MPTLESNGIQLNYTDSGGDGRPVVLIHGWPLNGDSWSGQTPALTAAGYRVITYDRRGFGSSDKPDSGYDYDAFAADLAGLLEQLNLTDATLVGFSMGGGEVVRYLAARGDERVRSGVLAAAVPPFLLKTDDNPDGGPTQDDIDGMKQGLSADRESFLDDFSKGFFGVDGEVKVTEDQRQEALAQASKAEINAMLACIDAFATTDFRSDLPKISVPVLVLHGDSDATVPFEVSGKRSAEALSDSSTVIIEGGPHGLNASHAEQFNSALLEFLAD